MLKLLLDETFNNDILRGLLHLKPDLDYVRVQDVQGLLGAHDQDVLEWAAQQDRILLTQDVQTLTAYAYERVEAGLRMPRVFEVRRNAPIGQVVEDLLLLVECSFEDEWQGQVRYLPFQ